MNRSTALPALLAAVLFAGVSCTKESDSTINDAAKDGASAIQNAANGAKDTIEKKTGELADAAKKTAEDLKATATDALPKPPTAPGTTEVIVPENPEISAALLDPSKATAEAPATYRAKFDTSKGTFVLECHRDWSPRGADRFYNLVKCGFYNDVRFFRVIRGFMVQFGINGDPAVSRVWKAATIKDDPVKKSNQRAFITFAKSGMPNSRTSQVFINFGDNGRLDADGFAPFGQVVEGMDVVDSLYAGYGGTPSSAQQVIQSRGNAFLDEKFPELDYVKTAVIE